MIGDSTTRNPVWPLEPERTAASTEEQWEIAPKTYIEVTVSCCNCWRLPVVRKPKQKAL